MKLNSRHIRTNRLTLQQGRSETLDGRDYKVYPVVALVEGVLQGGNADKPELALASAFGLYDGIGWNGRPLVLNHPKINGTFVSANEPEVLQDWAFGFVFASHMEGSSLKVEAWVDVAKAQELGGEFQKVLDILEAAPSDNDVQLEVSTGLYCEVINQQGVHNGKRFFGIWDKVVPDHLAVLSPGIKGACSVEDGCGIPRINAQKEDSKNMTQKINQADPAPAPAEVCSCQKPKAADPAVNRNYAGTELYQLIVNTLPKDVTFSNAEEVIGRALRDHFDGIDEYYIWPVVVTSEVVVYERGWGDYYSLAYSMDSNGNVTFEGEPTKVNLLTRIIDRGDAQTQEGSNMSNPSVNTDTGSTVANAPQPNTVPAVAPKVHTLESYIQDAPENLRGLLLEGQARVQAHRSALIEKISANKANTFTPEVLAKMETTVLEGISSLAVETPKAVEAPTPAPAVNQASVNVDYTGVAGGQAPITANAEPEGRFIPAPSVFG